MNNTDTEKVIRKIARERGYEGDLTDAAVAACAKVYESCIGKGGALSPKKYMRAPNGKPTKLTEMQWLLTRTPAFKRWFGDSMVKDENGDPQVMYHGTKDDFASFRLDFIGMRKSAMTLWAGAGFYFSDVRKEAEIYAKKGGVVKEVFLRLERPLVVDETGNAETWGDHVTRDEAVAIMMDGDNTHWMDVELPKLLAEQDLIATGKMGNAARYKEMKRRERVKNFVKRMKTDVVKLKAAALAYGSRSQRKFLDSIMKHTNHDGIIHRIAPGVTEWVVYDPTAIKSATDNNGEYSDKKTAVADAADDGMNKVVDALKGFGKGFKGSGQGSNRHNIDESESGSVKTKGTDDMATATGKVNGFFNNLIVSLKGLVPEEKATDEVAMDIVDRHGRHHQPKAIPEGGQYEEEGQYLSGSAKIEHAIRNAGRGKHGKIMRECVAPLYKKMGVDSVTRAKLQKMHEEIRDMPKRTLQRKQVEMFRQMKKSAEDYEAVRNMSKEEFQAWYDNHPEYHNEIADRLLSKGRYKAHFGVHGGYHDDGSGVQKHAAWEEAKWGVGAKVVTALMQFQEYSDAINGVPDQVMEAAIERAESAPEIAPAAVREDIVVGGGREGVGEQGAGAAGGALSAAPAVTEEEIRDVVRKFNDLHHSNTNEDNGVGELTAFLERATNGGFDNTPAGGGLHSNDNQFLNDIIAAVGEDHPYVRAIRTAIAGGAGSAVTGVGAGTAGGVMTYRDRDGNEQTVQHNEGGLKATIHPTELGAVQAEMRDAFAAAGRDEEGAEEYAHALSHFLGRGNDARSPYAGMRTEGLEKFRLAEKMKARLDKKQAKLDEATATNDAEAQREAALDLDATKKAINRIAQVCGITPNMLEDARPGNEYESLMSVIRTAPAATETVQEVVAPAHQGVIGALRALANPTAEQGAPTTGTAETPAPAETPTAPTATAPTGAEAATPAPAASGSTAETPNGNGHIQRAENYYNGLNDSTKNRLRTEVANSSGTDFETAHHEAEQNASASASSMGNQSINRGTVYSGVMAKGLAWQKVSDLRRQKAEAEARGDTAAAEDLENQAVRAENAARAIGNFLARANLRDENGNFVTKEALARNMIESYRAAWQRSTERHPDDYEAVANSRGVTGQEDAILAMGEILGFTPDFVGGGTVEMRWNGGGTTQGVAEQATPAVSERVATPSAAPEATATPQTAETPTEAAQTAPTGGTAEGGVREPTEEEWNDFVNSIEERTPYTRDQVESFIRDLRNGGVVPQDNRVNGLRTALANHPVMRYLESRGNLGATPQAAETPVAPTPSETPAAPTPAAAQTEPEPTPAPANANGGGFTPTDEQFRAIAGQRAGGFTRRSIESVLNGETFTDEDGAITPAEMAQRLRSYQGTEGDLRNRIADEIERRNNLPNTRQQQATPAAAQATPAGGAQTQGAQASRIPTPQDINANPGLRAERTASGANAYPGLLADPNNIGNVYTQGSLEQRRQIRELRGQGYTWPVRGRNARITADQITPELAMQVAANLATGRQSYRHAYVALQYLQALANPAAMENNYSGATRINEITTWNTSRNANNRRFRQMFDALHPGYFENRAEMRRQAELNANRERLRRETQNFAAAGQQVNNDGPLREGVAQRVNFTEADANDAVNRMVQAIGEEHRSQIQQAMTAFQRNGVIPNGAQSYINQILPEDHPVRRAITDANNRIALEVERNRGIARTWRTPSSPETQAKVKKAAADHGFMYQEEGRAPALMNRDIGLHRANCYINTTTQRAQKMGIIAKPKPGWVGQENTNNFAKRQMAYAREFEPVQREDGTVDEARIRELMSKMADGDQISAWSGGHNVLLTKIGSMFYKDDGYFDEQAVPTSPSKAVDYMTNINADTYEQEKRNAAAGNRDSRARLALVKFAARHNILKRNGGNMKIPDEELEQEMKRTFALGNGSFVIPKDAPLLAEEWELIDPA